MSENQTPGQEGLPVTAPEGTSLAGKFALVFLVAAALAVGEIYISSQLKSLRGGFEAQQAKMQKDQEDVATRIANLERANALQLNAIKVKLDEGSKRMGTTGGELRQERAQVVKLESEQKAQTEVLKKELKANQDQVGVLSQDVSAARTDLDGTKKSVESLRSDLGMARSELGTLIARNHDQIEQLRRVGDRDYFEFTLNRNQPAHVAGVGLILRKTNLKAHRFNIAVLADDMEVEKKDRTVNEPVFFFVAGSKNPYELVVNHVQSNKVTGYLSAAKGVVEVATRSEGAH